MSDKFKVKKMGQDSQSFLRQLSMIFVTLGVKVPIYIKDSLVFEVEG